jgi:hypothetical protein
LFALDKKNLKLQSLLNTVGAPSGHFSSSTAGSSVVVAKAAVVVLVIDFVVNLVVKIDRFGAPKNDVKIVQKRRLTAKTFTPNFCAF